MEYEIELYEKTDKKSPVLDFIVSLNPKQQAKIYREIELLKKFGNELHFPHVRRMEIALNRMNDYIGRNKNEVG
jgi:hypothetical protein